MKWNCPHCSTALSVPDEKLEAPWTFSRCFQCGGYALLKKPEISLIKLDRAPSGGEIKLPDGSVMHQLGQNALQHYQEVQTKPKIIPSQRTLQSMGHAMDQRSLATQPILDVASKVTQQIHPNEIPAAFGQKPLPTPQVAGFNVQRSGAAPSLPDPLPELSEAPWYGRLIPGLLVLAMTMAAGILTVRFLQSRLLSTNDTSVAQTTSTTNPNQTDPKVEQSAPARDEESRGVSAPAQ